MQCPAIIAVRGHMLNKVVDFFSAVREMIALGCAVICIQARWHLWERWKQDAPKDGPFGERSDLI